MVWSMDIDAQLYRAIGDSVDEEGELSDEVKKGNLGQTSLLSC